MIAISRRPAIVLGAFATYFGVVLAVAVLTHFGDIPKSNYLPQEPLSLFVQWGHKGAVYALAVWLALGDGSWFVRLVVCLAVLTWVCIVWQAGLHVAGLGNFGFYPLLHVPYLIFASLGMLAVARLATAMQLLDECNAGPLVKRPRQFKIIHLLLATAGIAAALGILRIVAPNDLGYLHWWNDISFHQNAVVWIPVEIVAVVPTALMLVFYRRTWLIAIGWLIIASAAGTLIQRLLWLGPRATQNLFFFTLVSVENAGLSLFVMTWILAALRWTGYRLCWRRTARSELKPPLAAA